MVATLSVFTACLTLLLASQHALAQAPIDPSQIPSACQSDCSEITSMATSCGSDIACLCTNSFVDGLTQCFSCAVTTGLSPATGQSVLDQFADGCNTIGYPVTAGTITGSSSSGSSTSSSAGTSTGTASTPVGSAGTSTGTASTPSVSSSTSSSQNNGAAPIVASAGAFVLAAVGATILLA